jgi:EpsI family protein
MAGAPRDRDSSVVISRRAVLAGSALLATGAAAFAATPRRVEHRLAHVKLGSLIADQIGPWRFTTPAGVVVASEDADGAPKDGYDQLVTRVYEAAGLPTIMLLLAYGSTQGGSLRLHRPETCYPGQGFRLSNFGDTTFAFAPDAPVETRRFTATRDDRVERLLYWTRIARRFPLNIATEYAAIVSSVLRGYAPDGILVRVSTVDGGGAQADAILDRFVHGLVATASAEGRAILLGDAIAAAIAGKRA